MRIFRQKRLLSWNEVIDELKGDLADLVASKTRERDIGRA
jgi:hypothetical protein